MLRPTFVPQIVILEHKLRKSLNHAKLICPGHEDTIECRLAWDRVEDVQKGLRKIREKNAPENEMCEEDPLACREYDM